MSRKWIYKFFLPIENVTNNWLNLPTRYVPLCACVCMYLSMCSRMRVRVRVCGVCVGAGMETVNTVCLGFSYECSQFSQS